MSLMDYFALVLGLLSLVISVLAVWIAWKSDRQMKALSDLQFHEKRAVLARHLSELGKDKSTLRAERIRNDLEAVTSLRRYVSKKNQEHLIRDYVVPILRGFLDEKMESGVEATLNDVIDIAISYEVKTDELEDLRRRSRGLR
ncbi:MAG: hypothetical protein FJ316_07380 [SAR202 cluster bacterium]|nr:hypothetical protein [SAR202 cluster bacterium]